MISPTSHTALCKQHVAVQMSASITFLLFCSRNSKPSVWWIPGKKSNGLCELSYHKSNYILLDATEQWFLLALWQRLCLCPLPLISYVVTLCSWHLHWPLESLLHWIMYQHFCCEATLKGSLGRHLARYTFFFLLLCMLEGKLDDILFILLSFLFPLRAAKGWMFLRIIFFQLLIFTSKSPFHICE